MPNWEFEYEYNGLHWRTVKRLPGSSVTAERRLFYSASWQVLEERIDDDVDEGFEADRVAQQVWGVRYIDDAVLRRMDANADGDYVDEGDRVDYYLTDAQFSVVAVVGPTGALRERVVYSPYGEARHHWPADLDGDGDVDSGDMAWYQNSANLVGIGHANYNPDADLNRDGVVGTQDIILALNWNGKAALASGLISDPSGPDSPVGYCGYVFNAETGLYTVRFRHYDPVWGRWVERDPLEFIEGASLYAYADSRPLHATDTHGLFVALQPDPPSVRRDDRDLIIDFDGPDRHAPSHARAVSSIQEAIQAISEYGSCTCITLTGHGDEGRFDFGSGGTGTISISASIIESMLRYQSDPKRFGANPQLAAEYEALLGLFDAIQSALQEGGTLEFVGCNAGEGQAGTELAEALASMLPNHRIVLYEQSVMWWRSEVRRTRRKWTFPWQTGSRYGTMPEGPGPWGALGWLLPKDADAKVIEPCPQVDECESDANP